MPYEASFGWAIMVEIMPEWPGRAAVGGLRACRRQHRARHSPDSLILGGAAVPVSFSASSGSDLIPDLRARRAYRFAYENHAHARTL